MDDSAPWLLAPPVPPRRAGTEQPPQSTGAEEQRVDPHEKPQHRSTLRRKLGAAGAAIVAALSKLKALLLLLGNFKLFATAGTMLVSVAAYSVVFGWAFAVGFVLLLLVHEMGHVIALRREGIRASAPMFVPFLGAVISARSLGRNALAEARVGLAGPILGSIGAAACIVLYHATGNELYRALAFTGFFLNLFNLIPVVPLDGGRAMAAMSPAMWFAGFAGLIALVFVWPNPILLVVIVFAALETRRRWRARRKADPQTRSYYQVAPLDRFLVGAVYLALIALLVVGIHATNLHASF
jgi:Zn-dependent protease